MPDRFQEQGHPVSDMQRAHIIHAYIAVHKIDDRSYSAFIGSEMIRPRKSRRRVT
jgi:hypothetical protein